MKARFLFFTKHSYYHLLPISSGMLLLAGFLACIGCSLIFKPRGVFLRGRYSKTFTEDGEEEINFGSGTRYINSDHFSYSKVDCSFGSASIYFDNAKMAGNEATFEVNLAFGTVQLYVPSSWEVRLSGLERAFGSLKVYYI